MATHEKVIDTVDDKSGNDCAITKNYTQYRENCDLSMKAIDCITVEKEYVENDCSPYTEAFKRPSFILGNGENKDLSSTENTAIAIPVSICVDQTPDNGIWYPLLKSVEELAWEKYWSENGEQLIWASWIEKYVDYINPYYMQESQITEAEKKIAESKERSIEKHFEQNTCFPNQAHKDCDIGRSNFEGIFGKTEARAKDSTGNFPFDNIIGACVNDKDAEENRTKMVNCELSPEAGEGWNPLSPFSAEESYNQQSNAEEERLIAMSRCDSTNGSIAKTNATSDSMTNVTKMTLSSSSFDSNSAQSFSLVSSVTSSNEGNATSNSSDQEIEINSEDNDKYWQHLWKEHFQNQYQMQYEKFFSKYQNETIASINEQKIIEKETTENYLSVPYQTPKSNKSAGHRNENSSKHETNKTKKMFVESVGVLMQNLTMKTENSQPMESDNNITETQQTQEPEKSTDFVAPFGGNEENAIINRSIGNTNRRSSSGGDGDKPNEDKPITLKRRYSIYRRAQLCPVRRLA